MEAKTTWSNNGNNKTIPEFQDRLIEIIKLTKQFHDPDEPPTAAPQKDKNANSRYIIKCIQRFRSKCKSQGYIVQKVCAEGMAKKIIGWRYQRSRENATTGEDKD